MKTWPAIDVARFDEDLLQAALADHDVAAIEELSGRWRVFFHQSADRDTAARDLRRHFDSISIEPIDVADEDWAARSQASLRAIRIDGIVVAPPWDVPDHATGHVIVIQPSMGFGTGHHATTRLCLRALQHLDVRGRRVLDAGTGSGVLAIAASLLGARHVVGIDDDPDAVQAAGENVTLNPSAVVELRAADLGNIPIARVDLVLANLTGALLIQSARRLHDVTEADGALVLSGFQSTEEPDVRAAFPDLALGSRTEEDDWVCLVLKK